MLASVGKILSFLTSHPLTRQDRVAAIGRFLRWQLESRLNKEVVVPWVDGAVLVAQRGMTGASGNIYCGLHEFPDMAFVLHLLRPGDLFVDVGANIGSYTILAGKVAGARCVSFEPDPETARHLKRNLAANCIEDSVMVVEAALGDHLGTVQFTVGLDTVNKVARDNAGPTRTVPMTTLDDILRDKHPTMIKLDVEGFEEQVLKGATNTLAKPSLLAVESECVDPLVVQRLTAANFRRAFYDPFSRSLLETPAYQHSNGLFVRDWDGIHKRLREAPMRKILDRVF